MNDLSDGILSDEHRLFRDETRRFVENEVLPEASARDYRKEPMSEGLID